MTTWRDERGRPITPVQAALKLMDEADWEAYKRQLARDERRARAGEAELDFLRSDPGYPLGRGYPPGRSLRADGESHREAWMRVLRADPCSFCGRAGGTLDHIEPRSGRARGIGSVHSWVNYAGACESCNGGKGARSMLDYLRRRSWKKLPSPRGVRLTTSRPGSRAA